MTRAGPVTAVEGARAGSLITVLASKGFIGESGMRKRIGVRPEGYHRTVQLIHGGDRQRVARGQRDEDGVGWRKGCDGPGARSPRVYVLGGDAALDEPETSEAIVYAGAAGLPNLTWSRV